MKMVRNKLVSLVSLVMVAGFSTAPALAAEIKIGFVSSLSGPVSALGIPYEKGIRAAIAQQPTIGGHQVKLIVLDDASDPSVAGRNARKLINEDKVDVLIGTSGVPGAMAVAAVARELKTPLISPTPMTLPGKENEWIVSVSQPFELMVDGVVKRMKTAGVKSVAFIGFSDALGDMAYDSLVKSSTQAGIKVVSNERYARTDSSVAGQVLKIIGQRPDAVFAGNAGSPGALPYLALLDRGFKGQIYGTHGLINADFVRVVGRAGDGLQVPSGPVLVAEQLPDSHASKKVSLEFLSAYKKLNTVPPADAFSSYAYDAYMVLNSAASRVKEAPGSAGYRQALKDSILQTKEFVGTQGVYNFKAEDRYGSDERAMVIVRLEKGKWMLVK